MHERVKFYLEDLYFSWDDLKASLNLAKHKITFQQAAEVFLDYNVIIEPDTTTDEERYRIIGRTRKRLFPLLFVVYVERYTIDNKLVFGLISAREATKKEVERYEQQRNP